GNGASAGGRAVPTGPARVRRRGRPIRHRGSPSLPAGPFHLAVDGPRVGDRAEVAQLVGVDHRADGLDLPVEHVEGQGVEDLAVPVAEDRAGLTVDLVRLA